LPERQGHPRILRIDLPLQEHGQRIDNQRRARALRRLDELVAPRCVLGVEDDPVDRSRAGEATGSEQVGQRLVVAEGGSDQELRHGYQESIREDEAASIAEVL
jgi:hypothetical protein